MTVDSPARLPALSISRTTDRTIFAGRHALFVLLIYRLKRPVENWSAAVADKPAAICCLLALFPFTEKTRDAVHSVGGRLPLCDA